MINGLIVRLSLAALLAFVMLLGFTTAQSAVEAHANIVEYDIPAGQIGVTEVVQHGQRGLVEVTLECIVSGKTLEFVMEVTFPDGGSADLLVRKQGQPDITSWIQVSSLDELGQVTVQIIVPDDAEPGLQAIVRIQDGPGGTGNHHGIKLHICVAEAPPVQPPGLGPPVSQPPGQPQPGEPPTTDIGTPFGVPGPSPAPEPEVPVKLPTTGMQAEKKMTHSYGLQYLVAFIALGIASFGSGAAGIWFIRRS